MRAFSHLTAVILLICSAASGFADGKVFAQPEVFARVEIANQQALISHHAGVECLVIETTFLGEGTNFGWVIPLPREPKIQPVSESFFPSLQKAFQPRLLHYVHHYYLGVLFVCGLAFLAWRSFKDEVVWLVDLPLCLLLAVGVGLLGKSVVIGAMTLVFTIGTRLCIRSITSFTVVVLVGMLLGFWMTVALKWEQFGLVQTLGSDGEPTTEPIAGVTVLAVQRAGVFDATTIRGTNPRAVLDWLTSNGFSAPKSIEPVVRDYIERGWVFVASKARRAAAAGNLTSLHPLAFKFATPTPVYPLKLTGVDNGDCAIDLYVFGPKRASASHFKAVRCDRVANRQPDGPAKPWQPLLQIRDPEVLDCIGDATIGTKLSGTLTAEQMKTDAEINWRGFSRRGATVYSHAGAAIVALNVGVPLAVLAWLLVGASRGGLGVDEKSIARWRFQVILAAMIIGFAVYWLVPKVEITTTPTMMGMLPSTIASDRVTAARSNPPPDNFPPPAWRFA